MVHTQVNPVLFRELMVDLGIQVVKIVSAQSFDSVLLIDWL